MNSLPKQEATDPLEDAMFNTKPQATISGTETMTTIAVGVALITALILGLCKFIA